MRGAVMAAGLALVAAAPAGLAPGDADLDDFVAGIAERLRGGSEDTLVPSGVALALDPDLPAWDACYAGILGVYRPGTTTGTIIAEPSPVDLGPEPVCGFPSESWAQVTFIPGPEAYSCAEAQVVAAVDGRICNAPRWTMHGNLWWYESWGFGGATATFVMQRGVIVAHPAEGI